RVGGGDSGAAVRPGRGTPGSHSRPARRRDEPHMPPKGNEPLSAAQVADRAKWIALGAAYDKPLVDRGDATKKPMVVSAEDRKFWSFRPLTRPAVPDVTNPDSARNVVDRFVQSALDAKKLTP